MTLKQGVNSHRAHVRESAIRPPVETNKKNMANGQKCFYCGGDICWDSDEMASEVACGYEGDEEAIVQFCHCMKCGREYEIFDPCKEQRESDYSDFWGKSTENQQE